jgi:hypothetical protein
MAKPETTFTASVHKHLPPLSQLHREKMANPYRGGTADYWYDGKRDLWVEWKFLVVPKRDSTVIDLVTGSAKTQAAISPLQQKWLRDRYNNGRRVWVIVGSKDGGVIFKDRTWEVPVTAAVFRSLLVSRRDLARLITEEVGAL